MTKLMIYRKESAYQMPKVSAADKKEAVRRIEALARVQRPELLDFIVSGSFHKLPAVPSSIVNNPPLRKLDYGDSAWEIPEGSLGKAKEANTAQAQSIILWLKKNVCPLGLLNEDEFSICPE